MAAKPPCKTRLLRMTLDQDWAEMMAVCSHSEMDACEIVSFHRRETIPVYRCRIRTNPRGDLAMCRLMGCLPCMQIDPWEGHELIPEEGM